VDAGQGEYPIRDEATRQEVRAGTDRSVLVEAAAGTGKTTLVVDRILQGIRDGSLRLSAAVVITFTEKAAGELEARLRGKLAEDVHRAEATPEERARVQAAIGELDRAHISTIHSFCSGLLREKPAEAGVDPEFSVLDETQSELLRRDHWREWMNAQVAASPPALVEALRAGVSVTKLSELAMAIVDAPEVLEGLDATDTGVAGDPAELTGALCTSAVLLAAAFAQHMKGKGNQTSRALRKIVDDAASPATQDGAALRRLAYQAARIHSKDVIKSFAKDSRDDVLPVLDRFLTCARDIGAWLAAQVLDWLKGFVRHYADAKRACSALDFQDLLALTARLLRDNVGVRRYFQQRFDTFFVDEFQDTDPLQAELIAYLCEDPSAAPAHRMQDVRLAPGKLVAVGDPKQSIYRFRRADVRIYEQFKGLFADDGVKLLSCNFRSSRPLLDWFNRLFEHVLSLPTAEGVRQAAHVPLAPGLRPSPPPGPSVVAFCPPPEEGAEDWKADMARRQEAHYLACAIRDAVEGGGLLPGWGGRLRYGDFALLLRALTDVDVYEAGLDACGVPYRVVGSKHFYRREQTAETLALLRAVDDPLDEAAVVAALRGSFFGASDEDLFRYHEDGGLWNYLRTEVTDGPVGEAMGRLKQWHVRRNRVPPHLLLAEILDVTKAVQAFRLKPAGAQRAANLQKLVGELRSLGAATGTFGSLVRHLTTLQEAGLPEAESSILEPGDDFVQIMSMHKAKGLQFDAVILPDLHRQFLGRSGRAPLLFNRLDGRMALQVGPGLQTASYEALATEEQGQELAEAYRLFYVACTRAKRLLVLPLYWRQRGVAQCFQLVLAESGLLAAWGEIPYGEDRGGIYYYDTQPLAESVDLSAQPRKVITGESDSLGNLLKARDLWLAQHKGLAARASAAEPCVLPSALGHEPVADGVAREALVDVDGIRLGSLFHDLMAALPLGAEGRGTAQELAASLARMKADAMGLDERAAAQAAQLALAALGNAEFCDLLSSADAVRQEVAFSVALDRLVGAGSAGFAEGSIDLVLRAAETTLILDYKTDRARAGDAERVAERYWGQLALYGLAARACGWAGDGVELALFFVRPGVIVRRALDAELASAAAQAAIEALAKETSDHAG